MSAAKTFQQIEQVCCESVDTDRDAPARLVARTGRAAGEIVPFREAAEPLSPR